MTLHVCLLFGRVTRPGYGTKIPIVRLPNHPLSPRSDSMASEKNLQELFHETLKEHLFCGKEDPERTAQNG
jgi:hypothetical protein